MVSLATWWVQLILILLVMTIWFVIDAKKSGRKNTVNSRTYLNLEKSRVVNGFDRYSHSTYHRTRHQK